MFRYERLLTSGLLWYEKRERHNSYYADCTICPHKRAVHPVVFKISVDRDLQNSTVRLQPLNTMVLTQFLKIMVGTQLPNCLPLRQTNRLSIYMAQSQLSNSRLHGRELNSLCPNGRDKNCLPGWPIVNSQLTLFQSLQILRTIASGHDVIHTTPSFPIWGLLWQLWLSYPLHVSAELYPILCTWTKSRIVQCPTKMNDKI